MGCIRIPLPICKLSKPVLLFSMWLINDFFHLRVIIAMVFAFVSAACCGKIFRELAFQQWMNLYGLLLTHLFCSAIIKWASVNVLVWPLPRCLQVKACANIICPHRSIHPQPVSPVGPVPPAETKNDEKKAWPSGHGAGLVIQRSYKSSFLTITSRRISSTDSSPVLHLLWILPAVHVSLIPAGTF